MENSGTNWLWMVSWATRFESLMIGLKPGLTQAAGANFHSHGLQKERARAVARGAAREGHQG